jgi:hypothetical protein
MKKLVKEYNQSFHYSKPQVGLEMDLQASRKYICNKQAGINLITHYPKD